MTGSLRILVAGATGVVGRRLVAALRAQRHHVIGLTRSEAKSRDLLTLGAEPAIADAYRADALREVLVQAAPDVVMHQLTDLGDADGAANARLRREGTANLITASRAAGVSRVIAQSIAWAYTAGASPAHESTPLDLGAPEPRRTTIEAVAALESLVLGMPHGTVLRYGMLYGPDTWYMPGGLHAQAAVDGRLAPDRSVTSFLHVDDAAAAAVRSLAWQPGVYNVVDDDPAMGVQWVPDFCRFLGLEAPHPRRVRLPWARGATNKAARAQGWAPAHPTWRENW